jgi:Cu+-exporting ATPase
VLDVGGMKCGSCSAAVKRILLQQPSVAAAAVNLLTETAVVKVLLPTAAGEGTAQPGSSGTAEELAAAAAEALTAKGFPATLRSMEAGVAGDAATLSERKEQELKKRWVGEPEHSVAGWAEKGP